MVFQKAKDIVFSEELKVTSTANSADLQTIGYLRETSSSFLPPVV